MHCGSRGDLQRHGERSSPPTPAALGLSKSKKKAYVLGRASVRLAKAGNATVSVRVSKRVMKRLQKLRRLVVIVATAAPSTARAPG